MKNINLLKQAGIAIPAGATSFYTQDSKIIFHINDWPPEERCFQSRWHSHAQQLTAQQVDTLRRAYRLGTFGWELEVADAHGYQDCEL